MYINKIDDLIDRILDDFYNKMILKKDASKYFNEINFVKYQMELNKILVDYANSINIAEINEIIKDEDNTKKIVELIKKYLAYYVFMTYCFFYSGKIEMFINNIVEYSKNQSGYNFKVVSFFNSDSNGIIIRFYSLIKNILVLLEADSVKLSNLAKKKEYTESIGFLNDIGQDIIDKSFKLKNLNGNVKDQCHNIIKMIILVELYFKTDKKEVQDLLNKTEQAEGEFIYIDIVVPTIDFIDYNTIEVSLSKEDVENGLASEIYDLITASEIIYKEKSHEDKIVDLLNSKVVVPVTEDFLLYHKDSEKYEKYFGSEIVTTKSKKKDETKIKYIINKIDGVTEYFSESTKQKQNIKDEIQKYFYGPLNDRRAVLINNSEDINIINKLQNQGRRAIESNEYYNDLLNYRQYPYINFKDFQKYGFGITPNKTIDTIRSVNFEKVNINNKNKSIQFRVGRDYQINIVGFVIPSTHTDIKCLKLKDFIDVRNVGYKENDKVEKTDNGFNGTLKVIRKNLISSKDKRRPSFVWLFDLEKDKVKFDKYEISTKLNVNEHTKIMVSTLYDHILMILTNQVIQIINDKKEILLQEFNRIINKINDVIDFPKESELFNQLERMVYFDKYVKIQDVYDKKEDEFPGLVGDIVKLPIMKHKSKDKIMTFKLHKYLKQRNLKTPGSENSEELDRNNSMEAEQIGAICQHNITWDNISALRKKNPNKSSEMLFEFFQQYIIQNHEDDFICKSCGTQINLRNYVLDGTYDDDGRFVSFNMPMEIPIEDIPEYEKYKSSIRNMEKDIDRIASIANINTLSGSSSIIKSRVKKIVKDVIDLLLVHNLNLKNIYKERNEKISVYGLSKELSNLFIFELENSIFVYSSKDKDFYKQIKRNNITAYLLFLIILELNDSQIFYMIGDKICNYYLFSKYGINWFNGIHIRKNNQNTIAPILNYKVLCYIIFYMSCLLTKYNLWKYDLSQTSDQTIEKKKKFDPNVQKVIIHTLIDVINSILEMYSKKKHNYIYDVIANKFFQKLNTTFKNEEILDRIKLIEDKKIKIKSGDDKKNSAKVKPVILVNDFEIGNYNGISSWLQCKLAKSFIRKRIDLFQEYYNISNVTNCEKGTFHKWISKNGEFTCSLCGITVSTVSTSHKLAKEIEENYEMVKLQKLAMKYCLSGKLHNYAVDTKTKCNVCTKCDKIDTDTLSKSELEELRKTVDNIKKLNDNENSLESSEDVNNRQKTESSKSIAAINDIKAKYGKSKQHKEDYYKFIDIFISKLESILGKDINLHNQNIYLRYDSYTINHDHNGYIIDKPYTIKDDGHTLILKKNHPFYKKDVLYYTNNKLQIDTFYDASTKLLLGYKEKNKEFQTARKNNIYIRVNNSIMSRLKLLGYTAKFINITDKMEYYNNLYKDPIVSLKNVVSDISRDRIQNLKKFIADLQRYIYRMSYNFEVPPIDKENNPDKFLDTYKNKLMNIELKSSGSDKKDKFLKDWKEIKYDLFFEDISNKNINLDPESKYLFNEDISLYDYTGNVILFYIVEEMGKLLDMNNDKFIKSTLAYLLLDIIVRLYDDMDEEKDLTNTEIKRFKYVLEIQDEREVESIAGTTEGIYEEYVDPDAEVDEAKIEKEEEDKEEEEALDMEEPEDFDNVDYEANVNFNG